MRTILLCSDGSAFSQSIYQYGAWFARQFQARVQVLYVTDIRQKAVSTGNLSGSLGLGASDHLLDELVTLEHEKAKLNKKRAQLILQNANQALRAAGLGEVELLNPTGFLVDCFHDFEAGADMVVLGKRGETAEFASAHLGANIERIVRSSNKPCLVTPLAFTPIEQVLIAYDNSPTGEQILDFLVKNVLPFKQMEIHLVTVSKSDTDQEKLRSLSQAKEKLHQSGLSTTACLLSGDPEKAIAQYIDQNRISLLLMGAYGHSRIRDLIVGSTTIQLLRSSEIPVLLFR